MKNLFVNILSYITPFGIEERFTNLKAKIYTAYLSRKLGNIGEASYIFHPSLVVRGLKNITIGSHTSIGKEIQLTTWENGKITIGNNCRIRAFSHITAVNSITIGDNLLTGTNVLITDNSHGEFSREQLDIHPANRPIVSKGPVVIGNNVWLGNNVCIMPGVTIGDGAIVAANSVVTHNIPSYSLAAGCPAKIIKS